MNATEQPVVFSSGGNTLLGLLHEPASPGKFGVVIVVGGPQYRVGSHRQFVLLARYLSSHGIPVFRFDYSGMGDSEGDNADFENIDTDIRAAIDEFFSKTGNLQGVVIWGLCDAASAALLYAYQDKRVAGLVLANPWLRSDASMARTYLFHYYKERLFQKQFWEKLFAGKINILVLFKTFYANIIAALGLKNVAADKQSDSPDQIGDNDIPDNQTRTRRDFRTRMKIGMQKFDGPILLIMSGQDLTAAEFSDTVQQSRSWRKVIKHANIERYDIKEANHTFSRQEWRCEVEAKTLDWMNRRLAKE